MGSKPAPCRLVCWEWCMSARCTSRRTRKTCVSTSFLFCLGNPLFLQEYELIPRSTQELFIRAVCQSYAERRRHVSSSLLKCEKAHHHHTRIRWYMSMSYATRCFFYKLEYTLIYAISLPHNFFSDRNWPRLPPFLCRTACRTVQNQCAEPAEPPVRSSAEAQKDTQTLLGRWDDSSLWISTVLVFQKWIESTKRVESNSRKPTGREEVWAEAQPLEAQLRPAGGTCTDSMGPPVARNRIVRFLLFWALVCLPCMSGERSIEDDSHLGLGSRQVFYPWYDVLLPIWYVERCLENFHAYSIRCALRTSTHVALHTFISEHMIMPGWMCPYIQAYTHSNVYLP